MGCLNFSALNHSQAKQRNRPVDKLQGSYLTRILDVNTRSSNWIVESETKRNSVILYIIRGMIGLYNHSKSSESPIILDSLQLSVQRNKDSKTS